MKKTLLLVAVASVLVACGQDKPVDSALTKDLQLASQVQSPPPQLSDTTPRQPEPTPAPSPRQAKAPQRITDPPRTRSVPRDVAVEVASGVPTPASSSAAAGPAKPAIGVGTPFSLASQQRICTQASRGGDRFVATLREPVVGTNGAIIPAGANVVIEVGTIQEGSTPEGGTIGLRVNSVEFNGVNHPVVGEVSTLTPLERSRVQGDPNGDKKKVIGGAIAGAIIGQMIGHNTKGTVVGAAGGAAAGAAAAKITEKYEACLPVGAQLRLTLTQALVL